MVFQDLHAPAFAGKQMVELPRRLQPRAREDDCRAQDDPMDGEVRISSGMKSR